MIYLVHEVEFERIVNCITAKALFSQKMSSLLLVLIVHTLTCSRIHAFSHTYLVQWRGEKDFSYSPRAFREAEFRNALQAEDLSSSSLKFESVMGDSAQPNQTNQNDIIQLMSTEVSKMNVINGASRCSTVRNLYEVLGEGESYESCASAASITDSFTTDERAGASWAVRCRDYRNGRVGKAVNVGKTFEREAIIGISKVTDQLRGPVSLSTPTVLLYVAIFPGSRYLLLRELGHGFPDLRKFDPNTRRCITSTPLEPIAAFVMANCARVRPGSSVIDLYAGSCATLLAAGGLCKDVKTVGVERDNDWLVPFEKIREGETIAFRVNRSYPTLPAPPSPPQISPSEVSPPLI